MPTPGEVTLLLQQADQGDSLAVDRLYRLVEGDLKAIARKRRRAFPSGLDASTTLLVDEAFCQLVGQNVVEWQPGDRQRVEWEQARDHALDEGDIENAQLLLDLRAALDQFLELAKDDSNLFRIRYFLGCTFEETAEIMEVSVTEAKRSFQRARLWLRKRLREYRHEDDTETVDESD